MPPRRVAEASGSQEAGQRRRSQAVREDEVESDISEDGEAEVEPSQPGKHGLSEKVGCAMIDIYPQLLTTNQDLKVRAAQLVRFAMFNEYRRAPTRRDDVVKKGEYYIITLSPPPLSARLLLCSLVDSLINATDSV
jgi:hypothetical protein